MWGCFFICKHMYTYVHTFLCVYEYLSIINRYILLQNIYIPHRPQQIAAMWRFTAFPRTPLLSLQRWDLSCKTCSEKKRGDGVPFEYAQKEGNSPEMGALRMIKNGSETEI